jgi:hypothetical protein
MRAAQLSLCLASTKKPCSPSPSRSPPPSARRGSREPKPLWIAVAKRNGDTALGTRERLSKFRDASLLKSGGASDFPAHFETWGPSKRPRSYTASIRRSASLPETRAVAGSVSGGAFSATPWLRFDGSAPESPGIGGPLLPRFASSHHQGQTVIPAPSARVPTSWITHR